MKQVISTERLPIKIWTDEIEEVMTNQADLVSIVETLRPLASVKG